MNMKQIPYGIDDFKELKDGNYYFVDKSLFIKNVINNKLVLYARPRRFGKTLNMSMLYYFFSIKESKNAYLFNDLMISKDEEAKKYQNQYPVIHLDLKDIKGDSYEASIKVFADAISKIIDNNDELLTSNALSYVDQEMIRIYYEKKYKNGSPITDDDLMASLKNLTIYMHKHYGKRAIVLIDEYDVPLQKAYINGYYDKMVNFIRNMFERALKTNNALEKGILTGCLRISKESIFTGMNNFITYSVLDPYANDCFGFTEDEVKTMLSDYHLSDYFPVIKEWYDGYLFGGLEIYNPWSVLTYVMNATTSKPVFKPDTPWGNSSGNDIVHKYIETGDRQLHKEFEQLMNDEPVEKSINPQLTYREINEQDNIYSFLLLTGYLKPIELTDPENDIYKLMIPNKEVKKIYRETFTKYFNEYQASRKNEFVNALLAEDCEQAINVLTDVLNKSISYYDNQESFYHGFMIGLLQGYHVTSNKEAGNGRFDIQLLPENLFGTVIIIECKHSDMISDLIKDSEEGARQILEKRYMEDPEYSVYKKCLGFGISFHKKMCYITETK